MNKKIIHGFGFCVHDQHFKSLLFKYVPADPDEVEWTQLEIWPEWMPVGIVKVPVHRKLIHEYRWRGSVVSDDVTIGQIVNDAGIAADLSKEYVEIILENVCWKEVEGWYCLCCFLRIKDLVPKKVGFFQKQNTHLHQEIYHGQ